MLSLIQLDMLHFNWKLLEINFTAKPKLILHTMMVFVLQFSTYNQPELL